MDRYDILTEKTRLNSSSSGDCVISAEIPTRYERYIEIVGYD